MDYLINFVKIIFIKKEFALFILVGVLNTINGTILAFVYSVFIQTNIAFVMGYTTGLIIAYLLNSFFVFHNKLGIIKFAKFTLSYVPSFIIQNIIVLIFYNVLHWNRIIVFILAACMGVPLTFLILKLYTFNK